MNQNFKPLSNKFDITCNKEFCDSCRFKDECKNYKKITRSNCKRKFKNTLITKQEE